MEKKKKMSSWKLKSLSESSEWERHENGAKIKIWKLCCERRVWGFILFLQREKWKANEREREKGKKIQNHGRREVPPRSVCYVLWGCLPVYVTYRRVESGCVSLYQILSPFSPLFFFLCPPFCIFFDFPPKFYG